MAKKEALLYKTQLGAVDLSLTAKSGEGLLIKDIHIINPVTNYITCKTEKTSVGYFRVAGALGNHLGLPIGCVEHSHGVTLVAADGALTEDHALTNAYGIANATVALVSNVAALTTIPDMVQMGVIPAVGYRTILDYLAEKAIFKGFPVAEGETFLITGANQATSIQIVRYEKYDAGDITPAMDNGSAAPKYFFLNYGRLAGAVVTAGDQAYIGSQNPAEFPDFPFGRTVPAKSKITVHGILGSSLIDYRSAADYMGTAYVKMFRERSVLFDDDRNGLIMRGVLGNVDIATWIARGISVIGNYSSVDMKPPFMFPEPITFNEGEELNVYLTTIAGAAVAASTLAAANTELSLICSVERA